MLANLDVIVVDVMLVYLLLPSLFMLSEWLSLLSVRFSMSDRSDLHFACLAFMPR